MPSFHNNQPQPPTFSETAANRRHPRALVRRRLQAPPTVARRLKAQITASSRSAIHEVLLEIGSIGIDMVRLCLEVAGRLVGSMFGLSQASRRATTRNPLLEDDAAGKSSRTLW